MKIERSKRLQSLPPYIFAEIDRIKNEARARGQELLSLGIGDPDKPTPEGIVAKLQEAAADPANHVYSPYNGTAQFRQSIQRWFSSRFNVDLNPETEIVALIGSKEGIAHFPVAFLNAGETVLYPNPGYPVFSASVILAGGKPVPMPMPADKGFLPDVAELERLLVQHRPKYMILNFPTNPTSVVCPMDTLTKVVGLAREHNCIIVSDNAYSEIYYDSSNRPPSVLEVAGAKDIAIEFHSFSKTFNMTGWRIGFAVGNPDLVGGLLAAKTNMDSGPLLTVQKAAAFAMDNIEKFSKPIRELYAGRREVLLKGLEKLGIEYTPLEASFFVWAKVPGRLSSMDFTKKLINESGLVVTPGIGFGDQGEGYFRLAMTVDTPDIERALERLGKAI